MSDKPRPWPNQAKEARDQAAEAAIRAIKALEPIVYREREFTESERIDREWKALMAAQKIFTLLMQAGAPVKAIDL